MMKVRSITKASNSHVDLDCVSVQLFVITVHAARYLQALCASEGSQR